MIIDICDSETNVYRNIKPIEVSLVVCSTCSLNKILVHGLGWVVIAHKGIVEFLFGRCILGSHKREIILVVMKWQWSPECVSRPFALKRPLLIRIAIIMLMWLRGTCFLNIVLSMSWFYLFFFLLWSETNYSVMDWRWIMIDEGR